MAKAVDAAIIGGGMITNDLILPSIYHLQRTGVLKDIRICALNSRPLKELKDNEEISQAFPGQDFAAYPDVSEPADKMFPDLFEDMLKEMSPRQAVVVAVPDQLHYGMVKAALAHFADKGCDKKTAKAGVNELINSKRCVYTYFGASFVEIPHEEGAAKK